jgi:uncharacterized membrane protein
MSGYLTDDNNNKSATRLFGLIAIIAGVGLAFLATLLNSELGGWLATMLVGTAFTGKTVQKAMELKNG